MHFPTERAIFNFHASKTAHTYSVDGAENSSFWLVTGGDSCSRNKRRPAAADTLGENFGADAAKQEGPSSGLWMRCKYQY